MLLKCKFVKLPATMKSLSAFLSEKKRPLNIGHRGAAARFPENTLESFGAAFREFKAVMVEFDVRSAKDGTPVIIHDARLERTTNGRGYVSDHSPRELKTLDAGFHFQPSSASAASFPFRNQGLRIPAFEEILSGFPEQFLAVEMKEKHLPLLRSVMALIKKYRAEDRCVVGSKQDAVSQEMRKNYSHVLRFCSQKEVVQSYLDFKTGQCNLKKDPQAVASMPLQSCGMRFDEEGFIRYLHERRIRCFFWTVNDPALMKALCLKGADGIMTDDPDRLREVTRRENGTGPRGA